MAIYNDRFDFINFTAARNLSPKVIARYVYSPAYNINAFHEKHPVLKEKDDATKRGRLALVLAFRNCVKQTLMLLGADTPERI